MIDLRVGLQTYTIRKLMKKDLASALMMVKRLGITDLELARVPFTKATNKIIREQGMRVLAIQDKLKNLEHHFKDRVTFLKNLNIDIACVSVLPLGAILGGKKQIDSFLRRINSLAVKYASEGIRLAFHHHNFEFRKLGGILKFQLILEGLDPGVGIVMDTYWIRKSGADIADWCLRLKPRLFGVHLRDYRSINEGRTKVTDAAVGCGEIDFKEVIDLIDKPSLYYVIEQNSKKPLADIELSIANLNNLVNVQVKGNQ